jgi:hypothetical protein
MVNRLTVDTCSLKHPERYTRSGKSLVAHLTGMAAAMESEDASSVHRAVQGWLNGPRAFERPVGPTAGSRGSLTVVHVHSAADPDEHLQRVVQWARSTWAAWSAYHDLAQKWIAQASVGMHEP